MMMNFWLTFCLAAAATGQTAFVLLYSSFPWWRTFLGRALFFKALILGVLIDFAFVVHMGELMPPMVVGVIMYGVLALGVWVQFLAFLRVRVSGNGRVPQ